MFRAEEWLGGSFWDLQVSSFLWRVRLTYTRSDELQSYPRALTQDMNRSSLAYFSSTSARVAKKFLERI